MPPSAVSGDRRGDPVRGRRIDTLSTPHDLRDLAATVAELVGVNGGGMEGEPIWEIISAAGSRDGTTVSPTLASSIRPQPFVPGGTLEIWSDGTAAVRVEIYDVAGRCVRRLRDASARRGFRVIEWDGRDDRGIALAGGVYLCRFMGPNVMDTNRLVLVR
jgi:hypothetical protein